MKRLEPFGHHSAMARDLFVLELDALDELPESLFVDGGKFACLLAWNSARTEVHVIIAMARKLLDMGAVSVSIWGEGCEKVHDIFDELIVDDEISGVLSNEVMTTWHSREPLSEAVFYLLFCSVTFERHKRECLKSIAVQEQY
jgi:putative heme iron utilization protein